VTEPVESTVGKPQKPEHESP